MTSSHNCYHLGWGINENGTKSEFPMFLSLPVVSEAECFRSSYGLAQVTSNTSFCVGDKSGRAPCNGRRKKFKTAISLNFNKSLFLGDSGGGLVIRNGNQFYLRGIVSIGLFNADGECSTTDYVSFTDVSLFTNWIHRYINIYT